MQLWVTSSSWIETRGPLRLYFSTTQFSKTKIPKKPLSNAVYCLASPSLRLFFNFLDEISLTVLEFPPLYKRPYRSAHSTASLVSMSFLKAFLVVVLTVCLCRACKSWRSYSKLLILVETGGPVIVIRNRVQEIPVLGCHTPDVTLKFRLPINVRFLIFITRFLIGNHVALLLSQGSKKGPLLRYAMYV